VSRVVAFGTFRTDLHPRVAVLLEGLRRNGVSVDVVNEPLPLDTARRVALLRQPWRLAELLVALGACWVRLWRRGRQAARTGPGTVLVGYLGHFDVHLARLVFGRRVPLVLDHLVFAEDTARDRGVRPGLRVAVLRRLDRWALRRADVVVCDTEEHAARARAMGAATVVVVPVGATEPWWEVPSRERDEVLRVLFFGLFTPLQGTVTIAEAMARLDTDLPLSLTLVGRGQDHGEVARLVRADPRVRLVPWLPEAELRAEVAGHDVVLGIFGTGDKARRVVPTKVYQGLAAGRLIVTSDTPPQRRALGDAAVLVPPGDPQSLADALTKLAIDPAGTTALACRARQTSQDRFRSAPATESLAAIIAAMTATTADRLPLPPLTPHATLRWAVVAPLVASLVPGRVLEIGCGRGAAGARIAALPGVEYTGVEPDEQSYRAAAAVLGDLGTVVNGTDDVVRDDGRGPWDMVCAFEVLEHLDDDRGALTRWRELTTPGGHLVLSVPAWQSRFGPMDEFVGHYRRYDPESLSGRLAETGWQEVRLVEYGQVAGPLLERVRNRVATRRMASPDAPRDQDARTHGSGRLLQPRRVATGLAVRVAMAPFAALRPVLPGPGTGLVAVARRPS
jgi:glycosyltransferase involved in cell wall biosynthesis